MSSAGPGVLETKRTRTFVSSLFLFFFCQYKFITRDNGKLICTSTGSSCTWFTKKGIDWLIDVFIWKPNRLGVPSYRESHVSGKGVPKSREFNIGMPQRRRQRVPQKWASKERRDCTRAVTDGGQGKRDKRLTPCYRSCACIWLAKNRKLIC